MVVFNLGQILVSSPKTPMVCDGGLMLGQNLTPN